MLIWGGLGGQALVLSQKVCRELCQQPGAVEKVHARVHVRGNRRSTRPLHGHLIKTTCGGLHRYCDCNFASQWPFTISCTVACISGAMHRPSGLGLFHFYLWSKSSFIQDVCLRIHYMAWNPILFPKSPFTLSKPAKNPGSKSQRLCGPSTKSDVYSAAGDSTTDIQMWGVIPVWCAVTWINSRTFGAQTASNSRCNEISP